MLTFIIFLCVLLLSWAVSTAQFVSMDKKYIGYNVYFAFGLSINMISPYYWGLVLFIIFLWIYTIFRLSI